MSEAAEWISQSLDFARTTGERYGYREANMLVAEIVNELHEAGASQLAHEIHVGVWRRLRDEQEQRLAHPSESGSSS